MNPPTSPRIVIGQGKAEKPVEKEVLQSRISSISGDFTKEKSVWDLVSDWVEKPHDQIFSSTRPRTLPPKSVAEEQHHLKEHREMVQAYKDKVQKEESRKARRREAQINREQTIQKHIVIWEKEILPEWENKKSDPNTISIWWYGIPPRVRGAVWLKVLNTNIPQEQYKIYLAQAAVVQKIIKREDIERKREYMKASKELSGPNVPDRADNRKSASQRYQESIALQPDPDLRELVGKERSVSVITLDLPRTFPALSFFQPGGPCHHQLKHVLEAFVCSRTDLGYVQGMSYLAAMFLLYMDEFDAFQCMCGLFERKIFTAFYTMELESIQFYIRIFSYLLQNLMPDLYHHLEIKNDVSPHIYFLDWVLTLFTKSIPIDVAAHLLDVFLLEGEYFLYKAGLGILYLLKPKLLLVEFDGIMHSLQQLTSVEIDDTELFQHINCVELDKNLYDSVVEKIKNTTYL